MSRDIIVNTKKCNKNTCTLRVSELIFVRYAQCQKTGMQNNIEVFENKKTKDKVS